MYLPGLRAIPAVDRDEARFAQASRQMFEAAAFPRIAPERVNIAFHDGGWAVPKIQDRERLNKPPLIYWLQVASAWAFTGGDPMRDAIWMYRVPSVLAAIVTVLIMWRLGCWMFDARAAWLAGAILAVAPMIVWDAHQARSDSVMMACTTGAMAAMWRVWRDSQSTLPRSQRGRCRAELGGRRGGGAPLGASDTLQTPTGLADSATSPGGTGGGWRIFFWLCLSAGIMTKGFVTPMVVGLAAVFLSATTRQWGWLARTRPVLGAIIIAAPLVPWLYFVAQHKGGLGPYAAIVWDEFFVRGVAGSKEGHFWPPGFHAVALAVLFWPGSLMTLAAIGRAWRRATRTPSQRERAGGGRNGLDTPHTGWKVRWQAFHRSVTYPWRGRPAEMFLLAWIIPAWIVFELSPAKLLHYTMPMLPAVALLSARCVLASATKIDRLGGIIWRLIGLVPTGLVAMSACMVMLENPDGDPRPDWFLAAMMFALACAAWYAFARAHQSVRGGAIVLAQVAGLAVIVAGLAGLLMFPARLVVPGAVSRSLSVALKRIDPAGTRPIGSTYHEDSLIFETRGRVERIQSSDLAEWVDHHHDGIIVARLGSDGSARDHGWHNRGGASAWTVSAPLVIIYTREAPRP